MYHTHLLVFLFPSSFITLYSSRLLFVIVFILLKTVSTMREGIVTILLTSLISAYHFLTHFRYTAEIVSINP